MDEDASGDSTGGLVVDDDQDELMEEMSMEERKERLKRARWNVFLSLGLAAIMFAFALVPMPFSAEYDGFTTSAEKDLGYVWGLPLSGEGLFDVPVVVEVTANEPPTESNISIGVFVLQESDCASNLGAATESARAGGSHAHQFQASSERILVDGVYEFEFAIDPGQYCLIVEYFDEDEEKILDGNADMSVKGRLYPNQFFAGLFGLLGLALSGFAFTGAQKHGAALRRILEGESETVESKVLAAANQNAIAAGPSGPPSAGPSGPPPSAPSSGPGGPPSSAEASDASVTGTFEPAENGYFFRKLPDGTYDQTVYVQGEDGQYTAYQAP